MADFEFEILSCLNNGEKVLRPYYVQDIQTIGVLSQESFGIRFTNNTNKRVKVKIAIDGTDILSGKKADKNPFVKGFIVEAKRENMYRTSYSIPQHVLVLKAWAETNNRGGRFVFTSPENGVASHTHGDLSAKGIISVLIFEEAYQPPTKVHITSNHFESGRIMKPSWDQEELCGVRDSGIEYESFRGDSGPATGVGETIEQKLSEVTGLRQPVEAGLLRVRYLWWEKLQEVLRSEGISPDTFSYPTGFEEKLADLGNTPRIGVKEVKKEYQRFLSVR